MILPKNRPVAFPNPILFPSKSVTVIPSAILPSVACVRDDSMTA